MIILASDTSTGRGSVAVKGRGAKVVQVEMDPVKPHSETLLPAVDEALSLAGLRRDDVDVLAVGVGPGAFTGLRVGLATFKGWASASHLPVLAVSSLDAVAFPILREGKSVIVVADARKAEVYACYYPSLDEHELPMRGGIPELLPLGDVPAWICSVDDEDAVMLGTGVDLLEKEAAVNRVDTAVDSPLYPSASEVLAIGEVLMSMGQAVEPSSLLPDYVRLPDAKPQSKGSRPVDP